MNSLTSDGVTRKRFVELVDDLRIELPGAQVLFAFLLTLPFTNRFSFVTAGTEKEVYFLAFIASVLASVLLIAPSALHRVYHQLRDPGGLEGLLRMGSYFAVVGSFFRAVSIGAVVFLVTDALYSHLAAGIAVGSVLGLIGFVWFALPVLPHLKH